MAKFRLKNRILFFSLLLFFGLFYHIRCAIDTAKGIPEMPRHPICSLNFKFYIQASHVENMLWRDCCRVVLTPSVRFVIEGVKDKLMNLLIVQKKNKNKYRDPVNSYSFYYL